MIDVIETSSWEENKESIKQQIIDNYISDFKEKELGWLETQIFNIWPFEETLEKLLSSNKDLANQEFSKLSDLGVWRKILWRKILSFRIFGKFVDKFMNFAKEKSKEIIEAETQWKLKKLRNSILWIPENKDEDANENSDDPENSTPPVSSTTWENSWSAENSSDNALAENPHEEKIEDEKDEAMAWVVIWTSTAWVLTGIAFWLKSLRAKKMAKGILPEQLRQLNAMEETLEEMRKSIRKGSLDTLNKWKKLWGKGILSWEEWIKLINALGGDERKILKKILGNKKLTQQLSKLDDEAEIIWILKTKFPNSTDEVIATMAKTFAKAKTVDEIKDVMNVMRMGKELKTIARIGRAVFPLLDAVGFGMSVWMHMQESEEADETKKRNFSRGKNKQQQANFHLALGAADAIASVTALCVASWPAGWIALGVGVWWYAVYELADRTFFDVRNFYLQNKEDYKKQTQYKLRQAILQSTVRMGKEIESSVNEKIGLAGRNMDTIHVPQTLEDAYWGYIYGEEIDDFSLIKTYNPEFPNEPNIKNKKDKNYNQKFQELKSNTTQEWKQKLKEYQEQREKLKKKIDLRLSYIRKYIPTDKNKKTEKYKQFSMAIKSENWLNFIEKVLENSKVYAKMKTETVWAVSWLSNINEYEKKYAEYLRKQQPVMFDKLEKLAKENPYQFEYLYQKLKVYKNAMLEKAEKDGQKETFEIAGGFLEQYYEYYNFGKISIEKNTHQYNREYMWDVMGGIQATEYLENLWNKEYTQIKTPIYSDIEMKKDIGLYAFNESFDKREKGITNNVGQNILFDIAVRLYNYEGANSSLALMSFFSEEKKNEFGIYYEDGWKVNKDNRRDAHIDLEKILNNPDVDSTILSDLEIDTATETSDQILTNEIKNTIYQIIKENHKYKLQKTDIEKEIAQYIKDNWAVNEGGIHLPYDLLYKGQKAGIGSLNKYFFRYSGKKIIAISRGDIVQRWLKFDENTINISYEQTEKTCEKLKEIQQKKVDIVHQYYEPLAELIQLKGWERSFWKDNNNHELDIPRELMDVVVDKWKEWQEIETSLYYLDQNSATILLDSKYNSFVKYFEGMYQWLLKTMNNFKTSDDINTITQFMSAYHYTQFDFSQGYEIKRDKNNEIVIENSFLESNSSAMRVFNHLVKTKKIQIIEKLWEAEETTLLEYIKKSETPPNDFQAEIINTYIKVYTKSLLEYSELKFDENNVLQGTGWKGFSTKYKTNTWTYAIWMYGMWPNGTLVIEKVEIANQQIFDKLVEKNLKLESDNNSYKNLNSETTKNSPNLEVQKINPELEKFQTQFSSFEEKIKNTEKDDYNWFLKRGITKYDIRKETPTLKIAIQNWDTETEVKIKDGKYIVWDFEFTSIQELLYHVTFFNRIKGKYLVKNPKLAGKFQSAGLEIEVNDNKYYVFDTTILSTEVIKTHYNYLKNPQKMETLITYLNTLIPNSKNND